MKIRIVFILTLIATGAFAETKRADLDWLAGTWKCRGIAFASEMGPEHPTAATATAKWSLNKHWIDLHYAQIKTAKNAHPYAVNAYWGYDGESKKLVAGYVNNMGGYGTAESAGWEGDGLTFSGPLHTGTMTVTSRDVFTKKAANQLVHTAEVQERSGTWKKLAEETCKR